MPPEPTGAAALDLEAVAALCEQATPGPWTWEGDPRITLEAPGEQVVLWPGNAKADPYGWEEVLGAVGTHAEAQAEANAEFIAAARTALPRLVARCRALEVQAATAQAARVMAERAVQHIVARCHPHGCDSFGRPMSIVATVYVEEARALLARAEEGCPDGD